MDVERFAMKLVGEARFHLRKKLEDDPSSLPVIEIPYVNREFQKIKEVFNAIQEYAGVYHMDVSFAMDGTNHLRWSYRFELPILS